jgi:hypothetical protein
MNIKMLFDFIQVLLSKRKHSTQDIYFSEYILFTTIYQLRVAHPHPFSTFQSEEVHTDT